MSRAPLHEQPRVLGQDHPAAERDALRCLDPRRRHDDGVGPVRRPCTRRRGKQRDGRLSEQPALDVAAADSAEHTIGTHHGVTRRAGLPRTTAPGATSALTTLWWSTIAPAPTVTPGSTTTWLARIAPAPIRVGVGRTTAPARIRAS